MQQGILLIHTTLGEGMVALARENQIIEALKNPNQREHSSFVHEAIETLLKKNGVELTELKAIAVTTGPGSYTGIRIGLAAAKGIAYAIEKPLVGCSTLELIAQSFAEKLEKQDTLIVPLIHARAGEYYAGAYMQNGTQIAEDKLMDLSKEPLWSVKEHTLYVALQDDEYFNNMSGKQLQLLDTVSENAFLKIVEGKLKRGEKFTAEDLTPHYLKEAYTTVSRQ